MRSKDLPMSPPESEALMSIISKAFFSHQMWSSFFSSFAASATSMFLSVCINKFFSIEKEQNAKKSISDAFNQANFCLGQSYHFKDACFFLDKARQEFDLHFKHQVATNYDYQTLDINLSYAHALAKVYLGHLDEAKRILEVKTHSSSDYRKHDILNLLGVIFLKQKNYTQGCGKFVESLSYFPNQKMSIALSFQCFVQDQQPEEIYKNMLNLDRRKSTDYLAKSTIFQPNIIDPGIFEMNLAHIEALMAQSPHEAFEKLQLIEKQYENVTLPLADEKRLIDLFCKVLQSLLNDAKSEKEIQKEMQETAKAIPFLPSLFSPQAKEQLSKERVKTLLESYQLRLETIEKPPAAELAKTIQANRNAFFWPIIGVTAAAVTLTSCYKLNR